MDIKAESDLTIIGGGGFIGGRVCDYLNMHGVRFSAPFKRDLDLLSPESGHQYFSPKSRFGSIVLLASLTPYSTKEYDDKSIMFDNVLMVRNLIHFLERKIVDELIYVSTVDVYGNQKEIVDELTYPEPTSNYGLSKYCSELILKNYCESNKIPLLILRLSQVFGENDNSSKLVNKAIQEALLKKKVTLVGNGKQMRDLVYVDDVARLIVGSIGRKINKVVNVASGNSREVLEIVSIICRLTGVVRIKTVIASGEQKSFRFNNKTLSSCYRSFAFTDFEKSMQKVVDYKIKKIDEKNKQN
ncbi:MAG: NAD-dependent epimerase/dehydratase [Microgenomates group bacterium]